MRPFFTRRSSVALSWAKAETDVMAAAAISMDLRVLFIGCGAVMRADYLIPMLQDEDERVKNLP
jgi:hypothetical protein